MFDLTLTFDNGPEPETTPFSTCSHADPFARPSSSSGTSTSQGRSLARRAHEEGHWIGNHTWTHSVPLGLLKDPRAIGDEIRSTQEEIGALTHPHRFFRPFGQGGNLDERLLNPLVVYLLTQERMSWRTVERDPRRLEGAGRLGRSRARAMLCTSLDRHGAA
jgi:peptidoglycan-N-acetylglucosamine deacetylase